MVLISPKLMIKQCVTIADMLETENRGLSGLDFMPRQNGTI